MRDNTFFKKACSSTVFYHIFCHLAAAPEMPPDVSIPTHKLNRTINILKIAFYDGRSVHAHCIYYLVSFVIDQQRCASAFALHTKSTEPLQTGGDHWPTRSVRLICYLSIWWAWPEGAAGLRPSSGGEACQWSVQPTAEQQTHKFTTIPTQKPPTAHRTTSSLTHLKALNRRITFNCRKGK